MADVTRKSAAQEDAVRTFGEEALEFLVLYWRHILIAIVVVVALILVFWSNSLATRSAESRASSELSELQQGLQNAINSSKPEEAAKQLDNVIGSCKDLAGRSAASPAGREAVYIQGYAQYLRGDYAEAVKTFQQFQSLVTTNDERARAQNAIGLIHEDQLFVQPGDQELASQARQAYETALKLGQTQAGALNVYGRQAAMGLGRVAEILGDTAAAREAYEKVVAAPSPADKRPDDEEQTAITAKHSRDERADMIRRALRMVDTQFSYRSLAQQRLDLLKGGQGTEKSDVHGTN